MTEPSFLSSTFLSRLLRDRKGNTLALVAAATAPLLAMVGSAVDIGRGYVTQSRLQQACDAGVLSARKKLGSDLPPSGAVLGEVRTVGNQFFDLNFPEGRYDTTDRSFVMTLEEDFAISATASAVLPTVIMKIFGKQTIPVNVSCQSRMNFTNLDIMMVLDVTGSMKFTNPGDSASRIDSMRTVIKGFHTNVEAAKAPDTRIRFGFVPYSTNVNAAPVLNNTWVAKSWTYQSREKAGSANTTSYPNQITGWKTISGTRSAWAVDSTYPATWNPPANSDDLGYYSCNQANPASTWVEEYTYSGNTYTVAVTNPDGTEVREDGEKRHNGTRYRTTIAGDICSVEASTDDNFVQSFYVVRERNVGKDEWTYKPISFTHDNWRNTQPGCLEELPTYDIPDYDNVDLSKAVDLNIDHVPTPDAPATQWKPRHPDVIYARAMKNNGPSFWSPAEVTSTESYWGTGWWWQSACPAAPVRKLAEMSASEVDTYLTTLQPYGATYHDIGMIWGARMLSPDGIFAGDNADVSKNKPTGRHMIFLTDGQTEPYDVAYNAYGLEPLDRRRWDPDTSTLTLAQTVESRFLFACNEIKKKNTTVWVIAFGTYANPAMTECAGPGHYFEAANAAQLDNAFSSIARSLGDLRVSR